MDTYLLDADGKLADPDQRRPEPQTGPDTTPDTKTAAAGAAPATPAGRSLPDRERED